jgi:predicted ATP-dependent endonuclease of OLD family
MYISQIKIKNYRGFRDFSTSLKKMTVVIGENDAGKTNFFSAISLPLSANNIDYNQKRLVVSDINIQCIADFYKAVINGLSGSKLTSLIPKISVTIDFSSPVDEYERQILGRWLYDDNGQECYRIQYEFKPKDDNDLIIAVSDLLKDIKDSESARWFTLPLELYEYKIVSVNNGKDISFKDLKRVRINTITAERDDFSESNTMKSNSLLTKLLVNTLNDRERNEINQAYVNFFSSIEDTDSFDKIVNSMHDDDGFKNIESFINKIKCIPNLPNLKNILSNITLQYGDNFLYQKGLGERNLIYIFILFAYYRSNEKEHFNLCCIEEPEAHLSVNNLRLASDFIYKSTAQNSSMLQTIVATHNPAVINKLKLSSVIAFSGDKAISLSDVSSQLLDYLRKRPNFDILKLLFANKIILVEGTTEEMLFNCFMIKNQNLNNIEVISIGQKGYRTFLDVWLKLNKDNLDKKIGVIRDFDNQTQAREEHNVYGRNNRNVFVTTTDGYTLENDISSAGNNTALLSKLFGVANTEQAVAEKMISGKAECMLGLCDAMLRDEDPLEITLPSHIQRIIDDLS